MTKTLRQLIVEYGEARQDIGYNALAAATTKGNDAKLFKQQHKGAIERADAVLAAINKLLG